MIKLKYQYEIVSKVLETSEILDRIGVGPRVSESYLKVSGDTQLTTCRDDIIFNQLLEQDHHVEVLVS